MHWSRCEIYREISSCMCVLRIHAARLRVILFNYQFIHNPKSVPENILPLPRSLLTHHLVFRRKTYFPENLLSAQMNKLSSNTFMFAIHQSINKYL